MAKEKYTELGFYRYSQKVWLSLFMAILMFLGAAVFFIFSIVAFKETITAGFGMLFGSFSLSVIGIFMVRDYIKRREKYGKPTFHKWFD